MASRKTSMTMADLEAIRDMERLHLDVPVKYHEHSEIFEELCQEAEAEDHVNTFLNRAPPLRRSSLSGLAGSSGSSNSSSKTCSSISTCTSGINTLGMGTVMPLGISDSTLHRRRHSTYDPRNRAKHRLDHENLQEQIRTLEDKQCLLRTSFVNNLLEFSVNFDVSSGIMGHEVSPALSCSCPVMSYMNDEEEDSVELRILRRPSVLSVPQDPENQSWESLKDDGETELPMDGHEIRREYIIELPAMEQLVTKPRAKRRRPHSYKVLEERLSQESQLDIIKSFNIKEMWASSTHDFAEMPSHAAMQQKTLDMDAPNSFQAKRESPISTRQQCARGA